MYVVVSVWEAYPGLAGEFTDCLERVGETLKNHPGVTMHEWFPNGSRFVSVLGYRDEQTHDQMVRDPHGAVARVLGAHAITKYGRLLRSHPIEPLIADAVLGAPPLESRGDADPRPEGAGEDIRLPFGEVARQVA